MKLPLLLLILAVGVLVWAIGAKLYVRTIEQPAYTVMAQQNGFEVRKYAPYITASVNVPDDNNAMSNGFRQVAGYIFGGNKTRQPIAMTAPVLQKNQPIAMTVPVLQSVNASEKTISFVLPKKWTLETLPVPNNANVTLTEHPGAMVAVRRYFEIKRGAAQANAEEKLRQDIKNDPRYSAVGATQFANYDPPATPFFVRRNEVLVPVEKTP